MNAFAIPLLLLGQNEWMPTIQAIDGRFRAVAHDANHAFATDRRWTGSTNVYSGDAGIVLFYRELYEIDHRNTLARDEALGGGRRLAAATFKSSNPSLYMGISGEGYVLSLLSSDWLRNVADHAADQVAGIPARGGDIISGDAGAIIFLCYAHGFLGDPAFVASAERKAERLKPGLLDYSMPGFSHGTAGVAYAFACLYERTGKQEWLTEAKRGGEYLCSLMNADGLIPHTKGRDLYYLGWCHGPCGTGRLFLKLGTLTKDPQWLAAAERSAAAIMASGIPDRLTAGYWNNYGQCCGAAGVGEYFLELFHVTGKREYWHFAVKMGRHIVANATSCQGGVEWVHAEHNANRSNVAAQLNYSQGSAGIGVFLLHLYQTEQGKIYLRFVDKR